MKTDKRLVLRSRGQGNGRWIKGLREGVKSSESQTQRNPSDARSADENPIVHGRIRAEVSPL